MDEIICYDEYGNPLEFLTQWDQNQIIVVSGVDISPTPVVRFSNAASKVSLVVKPKVVDNTLHIDIPNVLLTQCYTITVHLNYEYESGSSKTRYIFNIPVLPCLQPEDYYMTDNVDYVSWLELSEWAVKLILQLKEERMVIEVGETEPEETDVLWFNTGSTNTET